MDLAPHPPLTPHPAELIARGLSAVARAEGGIKPEEAALIRSFYGEVARENLAALATAPSPDPEALAVGLGGEEVARLFLKTCLLLSYADGHSHPAERAVVDGYAPALKGQPDEV